jgi:hypothetical protein
MNQLLQAVDEVQSRSMYDTIHNRINIRENDTVILIRPSYAL